MKRITSTHLPFLLMGAIAIMQACKPVNGFQPNIVNGGRIVSLTVHPRDNNMIIAAAETGGLFRTNNGGKYWIHLNGFLPFAMNDVKYSVADASIVLATAFVDTRTVNGGGIWRSANNGDSWTKPPTAEPPSSARHKKRISAYGISFEPGSQVVIAGTDNGVAISGDLGATWKHVVPDPLLFVNSDSSQDRIVSVLARGRGNMNIAGPGGIFYSNDGGNSWRRSATEPFSVNQGLHRFAVSPLNDNHIFLTTDNIAGRADPADPKITYYQYRTFMSTDGGVNWTQINVPENGINRPSFIKTAKSLSGKANEFELYYGAGVWLYRQTCTNSGPGLSNNWKLLSSDHADPSDIVFGNGSAIPIMMASDGGIHLTTDKGDSWKMAGGGDNGLHALQITEVAGHQVGFRNATDKEPDFHTDLYFGTQDNYVWSSPDGGNSWPYHYGGEGFYVQPEGRKILITDDARLVFVSCGDCDNIYSGAYFSYAKSWSNPNKKLEGNPFYLLKPGHYVQNSLTKVGASKTVNTFQVTNSYGSAWTARVDIPYVLAGIPRVVNSASGPVVYQPVVRPGILPSDANVIGLVKIKNIMGNGTPVIYNADGTNFGSLGTFATMFAWYIVYAVNPANPDHLIIADVGSNQMKYSLDGGNCWHVDNALTKLVTDNGNLRFNDGPFLMQVHSIAFDPDNPGRIVVGTQQAGVMCSEDGGINWQKIDGSEKITNISSCWFGFDNTVLVSSYGRGLWKIWLTKPKPYKQRNPERRCFIIEFDDKITGDRIKFQDPSDIPDCDGCKMIAVKDGEINDISIDRNGRVIRIDVSNGRLTEYDSLLREKTVQDIGEAITDRKGSFSGDSKAMEIIRRNEKIRGVVIQKGKLRGYIVSPDNFPDYSRLLMVDSITHPYLQITGKRNFAGMPEIPPGDTITITGSNFEIAGGTVEIYTGQDTLARNISADKTGGFSIQIPIRTLSPGIHAVYAVQRMNNGRLTRTLAHFKETSQDKGEGSER